MDNHRCARRAEPLGFDDRGCGAMQQLITKCGDVFVEAKLLSKKSQPLNLSRGCVSEPLRDSRPEWLSDLGFDARNEKPSRRSDECENIGLALAPTAREWRLPLWESCEQLHRAEPCVLKHRMNFVWKSVRIFPSFGRRASRVSGAPLLVRIGEQCPPIFGAV